MPKNPIFLFINKTPESEKLSQSTGSERVSIYRHVQNGDQTELPSFVVDLTPCDKNNVRSKQAQTSFNKNRSRIEKGVGANCFHYRKTLLHEIRMYTPMVSQAALQAQLISTFVERSTFAVCHQVDIKELNPFMWTTLLPSLLGNWQMVDESVRALSCAVIGQQDKNLALKEAGWTNYGLSLRTIRRALQGYPGYLKDEVFCACLVVLSFQHLGNKASQMDQAAHIDGLAQLMKLRGPRSFVSGFSHKLFLIARSKLIHSAILRRRKTFLAMHVWCRIPWQVHRKNDIDGLMDYIAQLPELYEMVTKTNLTANSHKRAMICTATIRQCLLIFDGLKTWFDRLPSRTKELEVDARTLRRGPLERQVSTMNDTTGLGGSIKTVLLLLKYWGCQIELEILFTSAVDALCANPGQAILHFASKAGHNFSTDRPCGTHHGEGLFTLATPICVLAEFCLDHQRRQVARQYVHFGLRAAKEAYQRQAKDNEEEFTWCENLIKLAAEG